MKVAQEYTKKFATAMVKEMDDKSELTPAQEEAWQEMQELMPDIAGFAMDWEDKLDEYTAIHEETDIPMEPAFALSEIMLWSMYKAGASPETTAKTLEVILYPMKAMFYEGYKQGKELSTMID